MFRRKGVQKLWGKCLKLHLVLLERSLWSKLLSGIAFTANKSLYSTSKLNILNRMEAKVQKRIIRKIYQAEFYFISISSENSIEERKLPKIAI